VNHRPGSTNFGPIFPLRFAVIAAHVGIPRYRRIEAVAHVLEIALERGERNLKFIDRALLQQLVDPKRSGRFGKR
jgi:hypothetical protein